MHQGNYMSGTAEQKAEILDHMRASVDDLGPHIGDPPDERRVLVVFVAQGAIGQMQVDESDLPAAIARTLPR